MNYYPPENARNSILTLNIMNTKSLLTPTKSLSIKISALFSPSTHENKRFNTISTKKYPCTMNLYPPENAQKFPFTFKYLVY